MYRQPETGGALHAAGLGARPTCVAETLDAVVLGDLRVEAGGEATRVAAERRVVATVAQEGKHGERHAERPGAIRGHDLDLLLREARVVRDLDHLAGLDLIRLSPGLSVELPFPPRAISSAFTSATMRAMAASSAAFPILAARALAMRSLSARAAPAQALWQSNLASLNPTRPIIHASPRRAVWRPPPYLPRIAEGRLRPRI